MCNIIDGFILDVVALRESEQILSRRPMNLTNHIDEMDESDQSHSAHLRYAQFQV